MDSNEQNKTEGKNTLDEILEKQVFTQDPFQRIKEGSSIPIVAMSNPLINTELFTDRSEKAWEDMVDLLKELYPESRGNTMKVHYGDGRTVDAAGTLMIVDGLVDTWRFNYSKFQLRNIESKKGEYGTLEESLDYAKTQLSKVPSNVCINYFYGLDDIANEIEVFSQNMDDLSRNVEGVYRGLRNLAKWAGKVDSFSKKNDKEYNKEFRKINNSYKKKVNEIEKGNGPIKQEISRLEGSYKRAKKPETLERLQKRIDDLQDPLAEEGKNLESLIKEKEMKRDYDIKDINRKYHDRRQHWISEYEAGMTDVIDRISEHIGYLKDMELESMDDLVGRLNTVTECINIFGNQCASYVKEDIDTLALKGEIKRFEKSVYGFQEEMMDTFRISRGSKIAKRAIPASIKRELARKSKDQYKELLQGLNVNGNLEVHRNMDNYLTLEKDGQTLDIKVTQGSSKSKTQYLRCLSEARKELHATFTRGELNEYWPEIDAKTKSVRTPDHVFIGGDNKMIDTPANFTNTQTKPTWFHNLSPFYDVKKAKRMDDEWMRSQDITKGAANTASSGFKVIDNDPLSSLRLTDMNYNKISLESDNRNQIWESDDHHGKGDHRKDVSLSMAWIKENDPTVVGYGNLGDTIQNLNYKGSATEELNRTVRIDQQWLQFLSTNIKAMKKVCDRSDLKTPLCITPGNHDRPHHETGTNIPRILAFVMSTMQQMNEDPNYDPKFMDLDYKINETGAPSRLDDMPMKEYSLGHSAYGIHHIETKEGEKYGKIRVSHKAFGTGTGDKTNPVTKIASWIGNTGRVDPDTDALMMGHTHLPQKANMCDGLDVLVLPSCESENSYAHNPEKTESSYGVTHASFPRAVTGGWKVYHPKKGSNQAMTAEFFSEDFLNRIYREKIQPAHHEYLKSIPPDTLADIIN